MNLHPSSSILQTSNKPNMFQEQPDSEPRLEIIEEPKSRGFRFRYPCEGPSHGGVPGAGSDKNKKTYPAVRIVNYQGYARIVVQLVTNEENPRLHPHSLVGKQCQNGICTVQCGPKDMTSTFPNLGIQHEKRKNVAQILEERYVAAEMQLSSINDGFPQEVHKNIKEEERKRIATKAQSEAKTIDLSTVRLMFIAYLPDSEGAFTIMLKPVISNPIFDSKAPNAATLKICRMDCNSGSACGGDEIFLLCDKVQKDDIQVRFYQDNPQGGECWEGYANFNPTDVHRQYAIVFKTPPYADQSIKQPVHVNVQLRRRSDQEVSEPRQFIYVPNKDDYDMVDRKRRRINPTYRNHIPGSGDYKFSPSSWNGGANNPQGFFGQASPGSNNKLREAKPPPIKQEDPQKIPLDPTMLFKINSIKQEPKSPSSSEFGSRHNSFQSSPAYSAGSPMSESSSPAAPSPPSEPEYLPGTRVPIPQHAKMRSGLPAINLSQTPAVPSSVINSSFRATQGQTQQHSPMQPQQYIMQSQMQSSDFASSNTFTDIPVDFGNDVQFIIEDSQNSGAGASPIGDQDSMSSSIYSSNAGSWANLQDVQANQYLANAFDQNHNPMQTASSNDIVNQAFSETLTGPGSGSIGLTSLRDPLMPTPIPTVATDINFNQVNLAELAFDIFDDIESDAGRENRNPGTNQDYDLASVLYPTEITSLSTITSDSCHVSSIQADDMGDIEPDSSVLARRMGGLNIQDEFRKDFASPPYTTKTKLKTSLRVEENTTAKDVIRKEVTTETTKTQVVEDGKSVMKKVGEMAQRFKIEEAKKTALAIHDYSVTGDIRMLLVLQRHLTSTRDDNGDTAIHVAVIHDQLEALTSLVDVVETLPESCKILDTTNKQQQTALHIACLTDNFEALTDLLRAGANPLISDKKGNNTLHVACRHGNPDILRRLLQSRHCREHDIDIANFNGLGLFHHAVKAKKNNGKCLKLLSDFGCDVNLVETRSGRTALHMAVEINNLLVAGCLISECDAKLEPATYDGYTPLHIAAANDCVEIAALLLACGADPDCSTCPPDAEGGEIPLNLAKSDEMRQVLNGMKVLNEVNCDKLIGDTKFDVDDLWWSLAPIYRNRLCNLLNVEKTGSDWLALADRLDLRCERSVLKNSDNPTNELIKSYSMHHGTCEGLRSALMAIGRHDVVQVLNKACNSTSDSHALEMMTKLETNMDEERFDSAIGSLPCEA